MQNIDYAKLGLFVTFNIVLVGIIFLLANNVAVPTYLSGMIGLLAGSIAGLFTSVKKDG